MNNQCTFNTKVVLKIIFVILSLLPCMTVFAADQGESQSAGKGRTLPLQPVHDWNIQLSHGYLPSADLRGVSASAEISDSEYLLRLY